MMRKEKKMNAISRNLQFVLYLLAVTLLLGTVSCGGLSSEELTEIIEQSQACETGDTCILSGVTQCSCPWAINSKHRDRVEQALNDYDCGSYTVSCQTLNNLRCENGRCVADTD
jgi:hypothetical protein